MGDFLTNSEILGEMDEIKSKEPKSLKDLVKVFKKPKVVFSGFPKLDKLIKGFRFGGTYLVGGLEKSGKSAFLMNAVNRMVSKVKVGFLNTELGDSSFFNRMTAIWQNLKVREIELNQEIKKDWLKEHKDNFFYSGIEGLSDGGIISFDKTIKTANYFIQKGARVLVFDNLTTFNTQGAYGKRGWEVLASTIARVINFTKKNNIISFIVVHVKQDTVFNETPQGIRGLLKNNEPERVLEESATFVRRPSLTDCYGGGGALSQLTGALLVWRPFQKYANWHHQKLGLIILDSFRHTVSGGHVKMNFYGQNMQWVEVSSEIEKQNEDWEQSIVKQAEKNEL